jgi:hypothetical protein
MEPCANKKIEYSSSIYETLGSIHSGDREREREREREGERMIHRGVCNANAILGPKYPSGH